MSEILDPPRPRGGYRAAVVHNGIAYSAGMTPRADGALTVVGVVGGSVTPEVARRAAALAADNALAAIAAAAGGLEAVERCLRMTVYVACVDEFTGHTGVADGASERLAERVGAERLPARTAVGVRNLPSGAPVEVELTAAVKDPEVA